MSDDLEELVARAIAPKAWAAVGKENDSTKHRDARVDSLKESRGWIEVECDRALYVDRGKSVILCDRLPSPVTMVIKLARRSQPETQLKELCLQYIKRADDCGNLARAVLTSLRAHQERKEGE